MAALPLLLQRLAPPEGSQLILLLRLHLGMMCQVAPHQHTQASPWRLPSLQPACERPLTAAPVARWQTPPAQPWQ